MDIFVETLTGTVFELHVSLFETINGVKEKLQRMESIPVPSQHLIYRGYELDNEVYLQDCGITNGSTIRLVISMRGGPINTTRRGFSTGTSFADDPSFREMAKYVEANPEEIFDKIPRPKSSGSRQVTLLVFRDGDQLNFFRVYDRGDGTLSPLSDASSCGDDDSNIDEEDGDGGDYEPISVEKILENEAMLRRLTALKRKMLLRKCAGSHAVSTPVPPPKPKPKEKTTTTSSIEPRPPPTPKSKATKTWKSSRGPRKYVLSNAEAEASGSTLASELSALSSALLPSLPVIGSQVSPPAPRRKLLQPILHKDDYRDSGASRLSQRSRTDLVSQERLSFRCGTIGRHCSQTMAPPVMHLPPIRGLVPKKGTGPSSTTRSRCSVCQKKTTLVTSFSCRCGRNFCPIHRYAEMHNCTFDYKAEGRQFLKQANPVVQAPKLPKI
eukprot:m.309728 g.309728  ORF g.309728 m.309728 type:complete len:440 (+) comp47509_c0_seq1:222-1541(+)